MRLRLQYSIVLLLLLTLLNNSDLFGQKLFKRKIHIKPEKWYAGIYNGPLVFQGDIKKNDYLPGSNELRWGLAFKARHSFSQKFNLQLSYLRGRLSGMDNQRNLCFKSKIREWSIQGYFNMNRFIYKQLDPENIYIFAYVGMGITSFRSIKKSIDGDTVLGSQGYSYSDLSKKKPTREVCFPVGFGMEINLNRLIFNQDGMTSKLYADFIFNLSNVRTDKIDCTIDASQSAKDKYWSLLFGVTYRFGKPFRSLNYSY